MVLFAKKAIPVIIFVSIKMENRVSESTGSVHFMLLPVHLSTGMVDLSCF